MKFSKWNFWMLILGIVTYLFDIGTDVWTASLHFSKGHYIWCTLTVGFILLSGMTIQIFSYAWYMDDEEKETESAGISKFEKFLVAAVHCCQCGMFMRYWFAVRYGYQAAIQQERKAGSDEDDIHKAAVAQVTDLSMLRLFETYLESVPQIILQTYILLTYETRTNIQYAAIITSFCSISWSTVDYQQSLRKSLPDKKLIRIGCPILSCLLYKLLTITSWILSLTLLADVCTIGTVILMASVWIIGTIWTCTQFTTFCSSKLLEYFYRMMVGIILVFTFFNVKGQNTKIPISIYYAVRVLETIAIFFLYWNIKPSVSEKSYFTPVSITVTLTLGLGIIFLILYYGIFHPNITDKEPEPPDVPDGLRMKKKLRIEHFLQY